MNEACHSHPFIARQSRNITRLTMHLIDTVSTFSGTTDDRLCEREIANIEFILEKMHQYTTTIYNTCDRLDIPNAREIIIDAIRSAK